MTLISVTNVANRDLATLKEQADGHRGDGAESVHLSYERDRLTSALDTVGAPELRRESGGLLIHHVPHDGGMLRTVKSQRIDDTPNESSESQHHNGPQVESAPEARAQVAQDFLGNVPPEVHGAIFDQLDRATQPHFYRVLIDSQFLHPGPIRYATTAAERTAGIRLASNARANALAAANSHVGAEFMEQDASVRRHMLDVVLPALASAETTTKPLSANVARFVGRVLRTSNMAAHHIPSRLSTREYDDVLEALARHMPTASDLERSEKRELILIADASIRHASRPVQSKLYTTFSNVLKNVASDDELHQMPPHISASRPLAIPALRGMQRSETFRRLDKVEDLVSAKNSGEKTFDACRVALPQITERASMVDGAKINQAFVTLLDHKHASKKSINAILAPEQFLEKIPEQYQASAFDAVLRHLEAAGQVTPTIA